MNLNYIDKGLKKLKLLVRKINKYTNTKKQQL